MNRNSPMMHRIARERNGRLFQFSIPRKGRIRLLLIIAFLIIGIRFGGSIPKLLPAWQFSLPELHLPSFEWPIHKSSPITGTHEKNAPIVKTSREQLVSRCVSKILKTGTPLKAVHTLTLSGHDSLDIYTSIDTSLTRRCQKLFSRYHPLYGALVALQPSTGRILALISYTHDTMPDLGMNLCCKSFFPAASTFKTVTAAAAIEHEQFTPGCLIAHRGKTTTLYRSQLKPELDWVVDIPFIKAYARSVNPAFARIALFDVGRERLLSMTEAFGFNTPVPGDLPCEPSVATCPDSTFALAEFASGFNQRTLMTPLHGACIAAAVCRTGILPAPTLVDSIVRISTGQKKFMALPAPWQQAMQPATAATMRQLMHSVVRYGTARKQFRYIRNSKRFQDFFYGGKTGSVDKDGIGRVDWFTGFAAHPEHTDEQIAVAALTVHGAYWTVRSGYLAAEAMRYYIRRIQKTRKKQHTENIRYENDSTPNNKE